MIKLGMDRKLFLCRLRKCFLINKYDFMFMSYLASKMIKFHIFKLETKYAYKWES